MLPMLTLGSKIIIIVTTSFEIPFSVFKCIYYVKCTHIWVPTVLGIMLLEKNNGRDNYFKVDKV